MDGASARHPELINLYYLISNPSIQAFQTAMTDLSATSAPDPQAELDALVAEVAGMTQTSLALTKHCLDIQSE